MICSCLNLILLNIRMHNDSIGTNINIVAVSNAFNSNLYLCVYVCVYINFMFCILVCVYMHLCVGMCECTHI